MKLYLVRHAESAPSPGVPEAAWPLSPRGRDQARAIASRLEALGASRVVCSPYPRARDTVFPFAAAAGLAVEVDERLRERSWGGKWLADFERHLRPSWDDPAYRIEGGESSHECLARVTDAIAALRDDGRTTVAGSHGNAIGLFLRSIDVGYTYDAWVGMATPHLFEIDLAGAHPRLVADEALAG